MQSALSQRSEWSFSTLQKVNLDNDQTFERLWRFATRKLAALTRAATIHNDRLINLVPRTNGTDGYSLT